MKMLKIFLLKSKIEFFLFVIVLLLFVFIFGLWIFWVELLNFKIFLIIFIGIWWVIVIMIIVGYGDFILKFIFGYFVGVLILIFGLIFLVMLIVMIVFNFSKIYDCYNFRKFYLKVKYVK